MKNQYSLPFMEIFFYKQILLLLFCCSTQQLLAQPSTQMAKILAGDAQASDSFGRSVSISGDYAIVGAYFENAGASNITNAGAAYIFKRSGTSWTQEAKLLSSDAQANDHFGYSVSISGDYAIVGAYYEGAGGSAYIFK